MDIPEVLDNGAVLIDDCTVTIKFGVYSSGDGSENIIAARASSDKNIPVAYWLTSAEYLVSVVSAISGLGFEKTIETIIDGAVKYKHTKV
jgi:hypothetical protein